MPTTPLPWVSEADPDNPGRNRIIHQPDPVTPPPIVVGGDMDPGDADFAVAEANESLTE